MDTALRQGRPRPYCDGLFAATGLPDFRLPGSFMAQALRCPYPERIARIWTRRAAELQPRAMRTKQSRKSLLFAKLTSSPRSPRQPHSKPPEALAADPAKNMTRM